MHRMVSPQFQQTGISHFRKGVDGRGRFCAPHPGNPERRRTGGRSDQTGGRGTAQGGPLSPVLGNFVLDDLDKKLTRRGHRFSLLCRQLQHLCSQSSQRQWQNRRKRFMELRRLGIAKFPHRLPPVAGGALANVRAPAVQHALRNHFFDARGLSEYWFLGQLVQSNRLGTDPCMPGSVGRVASRDVPLSRSIKAQLRANPSGLWRQRRTTTMRTS
ncbi:hypothetical protein ABIB80_007314 [Bradyrhizobium sp. i1.15.2]